MGRVLTDVKIPTQGASAPLAPSAPLGPAAPTVGAMEGQGRGEGAREVCFPNPNLQYGTHDVGYGWVDCDINEATELGYDMTPEGVCGYADNQYF